MRGCTGDTGMNDRGELDRDGTDVTDRTERVSPRRDCVAEFDNSLHLNVRSTEAALFVLLFGADGALVGFYSTARICLECLNRQTQKDIFKL